MNQELTTTKPMTPPPKRPRAGTARMLTLMGACTLGACGLTSDAPPASASNAASSLNAGVMIAADACDSGDKGQGLFEGIPATDRLPDECESPVSQVMKDGERLFSICRAPRASRLGESVDTWLAFSATEGKYLGYVEDWEIKNETRASLLCRLANWLRHSQIRKYYEPFGVSCRGIDYRISARSVTEATVVVNPPVDIPLRDTWTQDAVKGFKRVQVLLDVSETGAAPFGLLRVDSFYERGDGPLYSETVVPLEDHPLYRASAEPAPIGKLRAPAKGAPYYHQFVDAYYCEAIAGLQQFIDELTKDSR